MLVILLENVLLLIQDCSPFHWDFSQVNHDPPELALNTEKWVADQASFRVNVASGLHRERSMFTFGLVHPCYPLESIQMGFESTVNHFFSLSIEF